MLSKDNNLKNLIINDVTIDFIYYKNIMHIYETGCPLATAA